MRRRLLIVTALAAIMAAGLARPAYAYGLKQVAPAYFALWNSEGQSEWAEMCEGMNTSGDGSVAIINPASGPHTVTLSYIADAIEVCQEEWQNVIGYVSTEYGARSMAAVKTDIDRYYSFYPTIDGIFLDEMASGETNSASGCDSSCGGTNTAINYYSELHDYVDSIGEETDQNEVIGNMGVAPTTDWALDNDVITKLVIFEGNSSTFLAWDAPSWVAPYPNSDFVVMVYGITSQSDFNNVKSHVSSEGVSNSYLTDESLAGNPWDHLSSYWPQN